MRYGIAYGQQSNIETALATFTRRAIDNKTIRINGDGEQFRNFMHVSDHARANLAVLQNESAVNETINFDGPSQVSLNHILKFLRERHPELQVEYDDPINGDYRGKEVSTLKAQALLNWEPRVKFADGIKEYYDRLSSKQLQ
jgi:UDP-glucose 4-epimerase